MVWDELARDADQENARDHDRWIGVWIGCLAMVLAVCSLGGGNAAKDASMANIDASNTWAFFQAKNIRRRSTMLAADALELQIIAQPQLAEPARRKLEAKLGEYRSIIKQLTSDQEHKEGLDELFAKGKALEQQRDVALARDPYFDWGEALLQIAIVLSSVAIVTNGSAPLWTSAVLGIVGSLLTLNGFLLLVRLPLLG